MQERRASRGFRKYNTFCIQVHTSPHPAHAQPTPAESVAKARAGGSVAVRHAVETLITSFTPLHTSPHPAHTQPTPAASAAKARADKSVVVRRAIGQLVSLYLPDARSHLPTPVHTTHAAHTRGERGQGASRQERRRSPRHRAAGQPLPSRHAHQRCCVSGGKCGGACNCAGALLHRPRDRLRVD